MLHFWCLNMDAFVAHPGVEKQYFLLRQPGRVLTQAVVDASPPQVRAKLPPMSKVLALQKRGRAREPAVPQVSGGAGPSGAGPSGAGPSS